MRFIESPHLIDQFTIRDWIAKGYKNFPYFKDLLLSAQEVIKRASSDIAIPKPEYGLTAPEWLLVLCEMFPLEFYNELDKPVS